MRGLWGDWRCQRMCVREYWGVRGVFEGVLGCLGVSRGCVRGHGGLGASSEEFGGVRRC